MEVAGEVEVDILHRDDLRIAAAGRAALDAEDRAEGRLTQSDKDVLAELAHTVGQADRVIGIRNGTVAYAHLNEHVTPVEEIEW